MLHHLAQINILRFRLPMAHPENAEFVRSLDRVNATAEAHPGFVWRLTDGGGASPDLRIHGDAQIELNMSVWTDVNALAAFVYRSETHREIMRRRHEWCEPIDGAMALWWVPEGHRPGVREGEERLERLRQLGPTQDAFSFKHPFPPPRFLDDRPDP
ncbi:DUF3291 domain-containing protein [Phenylobacterium sp.]|uniref:DUF3291 domain-containing protein n=1 Tax=Phenylobacterium sp. TaxID=1871053 RepID=UPI0025E2D17F|nr:DUF3291 domain-containing protein [Phenylobacterium sp.]MCA3720580.1 DUF3291 domain-containing protein [Phenylobacterium sp.]